MRAQDPILSHKPVAINTVYRCQTENVFIVLVGTRGTQNGTVDVYLVIERNNVKVGRKRRAGVLYATTYRAKILMGLNICNSEHVMEFLLLPYAKSFW